MSVEYIKWKTKDGVWADFDLSDFGCCDRNHILKLFRNSVPVIAKENGVFITNKGDIQNDYLKQGKPAKLFTDCQPSERKFSDAGFLYCICIPPRRQDLKCDGCGECKK